MPSLMESTTWMRGESVTLGEVVCRHGRGGAGREEQAGGPSMAFPVAGVYRKHAGRDDAVADPNHVLFFNRGEIYRISHPVDGGDATVVFSFSRGAVADAVRRRDPRTAERHGEPVVPFPAPIAAAPRAAYALVQRLRRIARERPGRELEVEESALAILDAGVALSRGNPRPGAAAVRRRRADAVRELLASRFAERLTLGRIAREVGVSPFHLAREFREETGVPIHRYLNRLRLRVALGRITGASAQLAAVAMDAGFSSHAHFSDAFRREFGVVPSRFNLPATAAELVEFRKILKA